MPLLALLLFIEADMNTSSILLNAPSGKYLTFTLESEHFSLPVLKVREIMRLISWL